MFGVSLGLRLEHFALVGKRPLELLAGAATQIILLPAMTLLLVMALDPAPSLALGMIVVACCPGGASSNFLSFLARGDVAYSVALTATSSLAAAFLTPVSILFWSGLYPPTAALLAAIAAEPQAFLAQTTLLLAAPLFLGMAAVRFAPAFAARARPHVGRVGAALLIGVILYGTAQILPALAGALGAVVPLAALHNAAAFLLGAAAGRLIGAAPATRRALTIEIGVQNSGLALTILLAGLEGLGGATAIAAVWGVWHFVGGGVTVLVYRMLDARRGRS